MVSQRRKVLNCCWRNRHVPICDWSATSAVNRVKRKSYMHASSLINCGYEFVDAAEMRAALEQIGSLSDWNAFAASWNDLAADPYLPESARYRTRRYAVYTATTVYDLAGTPLGAFTLTHPFDATLIDDSRVAHGVTAVTPLDPARPGRRDVLVVTLRGQKH